MFALLIAVAVSTGLIAWSQYDFSGKGSRRPRRQDHPPRKARATARAASRAFFVSSRERRLWLWTLVAVTAIYSTLGPAGTLVALLRERNLLRITTAPALLLVVGAIAWQWVRRRPSLGEIGVALGITAVYLMVWVRVESLEERTHLFEYGLVATLIHQALDERRHCGRRVSAPAALAVAVTALLGWGDEDIQALLPNRVYDLRDVGFNALAGMMAIGAIVVLGWVRRRWGKAAAEPKDAGDHDCSAS
jgi:hypothetical protein